MKIIDGIKQGGRPYEIPDCGRDDLPEFFKEMGYRVGAEIGTLRGEYAEKICKAGLKLYAIDSWIYYRNYRKHPQEEPMEVIYDKARERLAPYDCAVIKKTSMDAIEDFADNSLDFVYIDGNHAIRYVIEDIYEWHRKVRPGGAVCGHDYGLMMQNPYTIMVCHVKHAVDLMAKIYDVDYYILGNAKGENRDKWRSWLWIKPNR